MELGEIFAKHIRDTTLVEVRKDDIRFVIRPELSQPLHEVLSEQFGRASKEMAYQAAVVTIDAFYDFLTHKKLSGDTRDKYTDQLYDAVHRTGGPYPNCFNLAKALNNVFTQIFDETALKFPENLRGDYPAIEHVQESDLGKDCFLTVRLRTGVQDQFLLSAYKVESLRRTLEIHGARTVIVEADFDPVTRVSDLFSRDPIVANEGKYFLPSPRGMDKYGVFPDINGAADMIEQQQARIMARLIETGVLRTGGTRDTDAKIHGLKWKDRVKQLTPSILEGGNLVADPVRKCLFVGYSVNVDDPKSLEGTAMLHHFTGTPLSQKSGYSAFAIPVQLDSPFYHIDTFLAVLPKGEIVLNPHGLSPICLNATREALNEASAIKPLDVIEIRKDEQHLLLSNLVAVTPDKLVLTSNSATFENELRQRGYTPVTPASMGLDCDWNINNAGARCLTFGPLPIGGKAPSVVLATSR